MVRLCNEFGNMFEKGIIDPAKMTRSALENAASIAAPVRPPERSICCRASSLMRRVDGSSTAPDTHRRRNDDGY